MTSVYGANVADVHHISLIGREGDFRAVAVGTPGCRELSRRFARRRWSARTTTHTLRPRTSGICSATNADAARSCPLPLLLSALHEQLTGRASRVTVVVALGTHAAMDQARLTAWLGCPAGAIGERYPGVEVRNHEWWDPTTFVTVGHIAAERIGELSGGPLRRGVDVRVNRAVVEHDVTIIVGPVLPHEVAGFSGGNEYLFPGLSGPEVIDVSHWLGALITSRDIIGSAAPRRCAR
ncbi:lactate racemase domain-containing protein [Amycolatopsis thermophila]|uniref:Nickel-dependent lactate racemase n=1 Tax=Amycolatopsis thermophila TaxID=206084 RepID=A0ABU0F0F4_9PSEU|nr:lactate racemase domain-containing protein [Amycolatopsis thermophila]MDQ0381046.1 nickel-dependent lactate racemase [Amycolatopsis thermophila]